MGICKRNKFSLVDGQNSESKGSEPEGQDMVQVLANLTGLPAAGIEYELQQVVPSSSEGLNQMNLEQLRVALAAYLDLVQAEFLAEFAVQEEEN